MFAIYFEIQQKKTELDGQIKGWIKGGDERHRVKCEWQNLGGMCKNVHCKILSMLLYI